MNNKGQHCRATPNPQLFTYTRIRGQPLQPQHRETERQQQKEQTSLQSSELTWICSAYLARQSDAWGKTKQRKGITISHKGKVLDSLTFQEHRSRKWMKEEGRSLTAFTINKVALPTLTCSPLTSSFELLMNLFCLLSKEWIQKCERRQSTLPSIPPIRPISYVLKLWWMDNTACFRKCAWDIVGTP